MIWDKPSNTDGRESPGRTVFRSLVRAAVGAFLGAVLPVLVMVLYGLLVGFMEEGLRAQSDMLVENMVVGASFMLFVDTEWLWLGGMLGAAIGVAGSLRDNVVRKTSVRTPRLLFAAGGLVAAGLILAWAFLRAADRAVIDAKYPAFCAAVHQEAYDTAYTYLSPSYRQEYSVDELVEARRSKELCLDECSLDPRRHVSICGRKATLFPDEVTFVELYSGCVLLLEKVDGIWYFTGETYWAYD